MPLDPHRRPSFQWVLTIGLALFAFAAIIVAVMYFLGKPVSSTVQSGLLSPLLVLFIFLSIYRDRLSLAQKIGVAVAVYVLSLISAVAYDFVLRGLHAYSAVTILVGKSIVFIAPTVYCLLLAARLSASPRAVASSPEDEHSGAARRGAVSQSSLWSNPVVLVALIQGIATILAALIAKAF
jgi:hypothetical protein